MAPQRRHHFELLEMHNLRPIPNLPSQNLDFDEIKQNLWRFVKVCETQL